MPKPTRGYLKTGPDEFRPLLWVQNNKPNEMLLGVYGLATTTSILRSMWPEQVVRTSDLPSIHYSHKDAIEIGVALDHVTCHADGRFHLKTKQNDDIYVHSMQRTEPLGPDTSVFLEVFVVSDVAEHYGVSPSHVKYPHIWFGLLNDQYLALRGMFAGINFPVETKMMATMAQIRGQHGGVALTSGTLKGIFMGGPASLSDEARSSRPKGTLLSFKFPVPPDQWHIKTFLFE